MIVPCPENGDIHLEFYCPAQATASRRATGARLWQLWRWPRFHGNIITQPNANAGQQCQAFN